MKRPLLPKIYQGTPWLLFGAVLCPSLATLAVGVVILSLWSVASDIALGVLTVCFATFTLTGTLITLILILRQNRLVRMQAEFVANVSHELRTPLTSIRMYIETLALKRVRSEQEAEHILHTMEKEVMRLSLLTEKLLDFRTLSLRASDDVCVISPREIVEEVVESITSTSLLISAPDGTGGFSADRVKVHIDEELPPVKVSVWAFNLALSNLIQNAFVHGGDKGLVEIFVHSQKRGVTIDIRDNGPGIALDEQKRIFERFYRGPETVRNKKPGFGIGLAMVREFAMAHGGRISVHSKLGHGSTFSLWLPNIR